VTPAPPTVVGSVKGSHHAIDVRGMSPSHGSQHAIDVRGAPLRGAQPGGELPQWPPPVVVAIGTPLHGGPMPSPMPPVAGGSMPPAPMAYGPPVPPAPMAYGPPVPPAPMAYGPPVPPAPAMPVVARGTPPEARAAVPVLPGSAMFPAVEPPPMRSPKPFFPIEPTVGAPRYSATFTAASGYDMAAAASYDKLVRRIIWAAVIIAVIAAAVIALH
jgi:hypothetical protein